MKHRTMNDQMCTVCQTLTDHMRTRGIKQMMSIQSVKQGQKQYPSFRKWHKSLSAPALYRVGKNIVINTTRACVDPNEFLPFRQWILGERDV